MHERVGQLPGSAWRSIWFWTLLVTGLSVIVSDLASMWVLDTLSQGINGPGLVAATLMPIVLGGPMMFYQTLRHQQLKLANAQLDILASTDWLTDCLNRRAFTAQANAMLAGGSSDSATMLVVDADYFKAVNDRFGHEAGDSALQLLATTIRSTIRREDLLARIGGEEFGVFLPEAGFTAALVIAERIRYAVASARFAPAGDQYDLSVSIGGATSVGPSKFGDLFRLADQQLYGAKSGGRNRIEIVCLPPAIEEPANINRPAIDKTAAVSG